MKEFNLNSVFLYIVAGVIVLFVIAQSIFFLYRAWFRARELNLEAALLRRVIRASAAFTIAPAIAILLGVITLSRFLGLPLPWLRLSVLGALTYELPAATSAAAALDVSISEGVTDPRHYSTIAWIMTLGIILGLVIITLFSRNIQKSVQSLKKRDARWVDVFLNALFLGMLIAVFLGSIFAEVTAGFSGWIPVFITLISALLMVSCKLLIKALRISWMEDYALPISMLGAMALSIPISKLLG